VFTFGRFTTLTNIKHPFISSGPLMRYQYDAADRLTHAVTPFGSKYYTYDANGNRTSTLAHQDGKRGQASVLMVV